MEEQSNEALWYVVHTYSGYENKVATDLQTMVDNRRLQDLICDIKVPTEMVPEIKDGKEHMVERKLFPGYVLVKMIMNDDTWYVVRNTRGCTGFVGPASKPVAPFPRGSGEDGRGEGSAAGRGLQGRRQCADHCRLWKALWALWRPSIRELRNSSSGQHVRPGDPRRGGYCPGRAAVTNRHKPVYQGKTAVRFL